MSNRPMFGNSRRLDLHLIGIPAEFCQVSRLFSRCTAASNVGLSSNGLLHAQFATSSNTQPSRGGCLCFRYLRWMAYHIVGDLINMA